MSHDSLILKTALLHGLPALLVRAVVAVESGGNTFAIRYEPAFFDRYVKNRNHPRFGACSKETEETARATSFGLMQVMGQVAREHGYDGPYLSALCDPATGLEYGCRHLARMSKTFPAPAHGWDSVCAAYNGGAGAVRGPGQFTNPEYPAKVLKALGGTWPERP